MEFREGGAFKTKILKGESEAKLDFPDTWVVGGSGIGGRGGEGV